METLFLKCGACNGLGQLPPEPGNMASAGDCPNCTGGGYILTDTGKKIGQLILLLENLPKMKDQITP